jgi:hypothetical protein
LLDELLEVSLSLEPLMLPELMPPLAELVLSEPEELVEGVELAPAAFEPYCLTQSSRSVPLMPAHWLGSAAPLPPAVALLDVSLLGVDALGVVAVSEEEEPLVDCAQAALARSAAAAAAAMDFSIMRNLLMRVEGTASALLQARCRDSCAALTVSLQPPKRPYVAGS